MESKEPTNIRPIAYVKYDEMIFYAFEKNVNKGYSKIYRDIPDFLEALHSIIDEAYEIDELVLDTSTNKYYIIGYEKRREHIHEDEPIAFDFKEIDEAQILFDMI